MSSVGQVTHCSVVIETSDWRPDHRIQLWDTLDEVCRQAEPAGAGVVVVVDFAHSDRRPEIAARYPGIRIVQGHTGDGYYANKHRGISEADSELVLLTDANCLPQPDWMAAALRAFETVGPRVAAVQGRSFFAHDPLSKVWDAVWWARGTSPRGPLDRLYTGNNLGLRRAVYLQHPYDLSWPHHTGSERLMGERLRSAGYELFLEPDMQVAHNYRATLAVLGGLALVRGYYFVASRSRPASGLGRLIRRLGWAVPVALGPALWARDLARLLRAWDRVGLSRRELWKLPGYALALLVHAIVAGAGAARALRGKPPYPRPS